jgi:hypothetical protein
MEACQFHFARQPGYEKADNFACEACGVTVQCINFGKTENERKMRPAFSTRWSKQGNHLPECPNKLGELVEEVLLEKERQEYTPGPVTFTLGVPIRKSSPKGAVSGIQEGVPSTDNPQPSKRRRRARHRMEDLLWLPESYFEMIRHHPNVQIKTPKGIFFSREYLTPVTEINWSRGHGVVYGIASIWPQRGAKGDYFSVEFKKPDTTGNKVKGNLFPDRFPDDDKLQKALSGLEKRLYHVALWWTNPQKPDSTKYPHMQIAQMWFEIRRIAIKTYH